MRYLSVCSGIEAATAAWHSLGWRASAFSEIEPFPSAVLAHHYPDAPNYGDITKLPEMILSGEVEAPEILCGGTPCQAFSVAGLRRSLDDARGSLSLTFCEIANAIDSVRLSSGDEPCIVFWENVPGVLNTADNAFGCFLAGLAGEDDALEPAGGRWTNAGVVLGPERAIAWRVLDAQYFGVAQRRRRVFVAASARNGFDPCKVLFEFDGVRRDSAPSRETREDITGTVGARTSGGGGFSTDFECAGGLQPVITMAHGQGGAEIASERSPTLTCNHEAPIVSYSAQCVTGDITHTLKAEGFDASEDGTWRGQPIVAFNPNQEGMGLSSEFTPPIGASTGGGNQNCIAFSCKDYAGDSGHLSPTRRSMVHDGNHANAGGQVAVCFAENSRAEIRLEGGDGQRTGAISTGGGKPGQGMPVVAYTTKLHNTKSNNAGKVFEERSTCLDANSPPPALLTAMQVRRLTPVECERLQGFPDGYTQIPWRKKPAFDCPDGPRYKALGNSWAVPCVAWIGRRIDAEIKRGRG